MLVQNHLALGIVSVDVSKLSPGSSQAAKKAPEAVAAPVDVDARALTELEWNAVTIGLQDGERARNRSFVTNLLMFGGGGKANALANARLEALRRYAELAAGLSPRSVATTSLTEAGLSPSHIRVLLAFIQARRIAARA